ncbi:hypothetical protein [Clostridium vincentii]|uniref:Uncharacterized protein n=1 Tax=Clostridium vincentii TaxID=52704 RepID=A0A2T0BL00_9CLOT|nr:hypothetical protein [Clostridium vincentii]PRR84555.1 hypothetical protein CLVI_00780 [Clostridium vincentii]
MQTIKITITSPTPANIVLKECKPKEQDVAGKITELLKNFKSKQEVIDHE